MSLSLCPLLPPGSSPRSFCVAGVVVCALSWPLPLVWFASPHDGRVLFGVFGVFWLTCCLDTEVTALHQCSVISPYYIGLSFSSYEFVCGGADFCHRPPLSVLPLFGPFVALGCLIHVAFSLAVWGGPFSFCFVSAYSQGGAVDPR